MCLATYGAFIMTARQGRLEHDGDGGGGGGVASTYVPRNLRYGSCDSVVWNIVTMWTQCSDGQCDSHREIWTVKEG